MMVMMMMVVVVVVVVMVVMILLIFEEAFSIRDPPRGNHGRDCDSHGEEGRVYKAQAIRKMADGSNGRVVFLY
jgi:uncharacterized membrane protein YqiK